MEKVLGLKGLEKLLLALLVMRALSVLAACWSDFAHPHITRQADTMGVVFRYFSRWFIETESAYPLLPATLAAGDQYGLAPTEFPLIGVSLAPLFHVGSMELSVPLVRTFLIIAVLFLSYWNYRLWQNIAVSGFTKADSAVAALIVPIFSISGLFLGKFIPDPLAFILALIALGFAFQQRYVGAGLVGTIAVLLKPPVIVVFALLLLEKEPLRLRWKHLLWISCLFAVVLFYYVVGLGFIKSVSDVPHYFHTHFRNPIFSLIEGLSYPFRLFELLLEQIFPRYLFPVILVLSFVWSKNRRVVACLWTLLVLQALAVLVLDGEHAFRHTYYFIGVSLAAALLFAHVLLSAPSRRAQYVLVAWMFTPLLEKSFYEMRGLWDGKPSLLEQCADLKEQNQEFPWGQGYRFRSEDALSAELGVCFGEILGSQTTRYGFFFASSDLPSGCSEKASSEKVKLVICD